MTGVLKTIGSGSQPITQVSVSGIPPGNATVSDADGRFRLEFPQQKPGDVVRIQVVRSGWEVINAFELTRTLTGEPDQAVVTLYLCERDRLEGLARWFLRELSDEAIEETYRRKTPKSKGPGESGPGEPDPLLQDRRRAERVVRDSGQILARLHPEEESAVFQRALQRFAQGEVGEALQMLDADANANAPGARRTGVEHSLLKAHLLTTQFLFAEAEQTYRAAAAAAPDDLHAAIALADFALNSRDEAQALPALERALSLARRSGTPSDAAAVLNNLGIVYRALDRMKESRAAYEEAVALYRQLAVAHPGATLPSLARTLDNLAILHRAQRRNEEALAAYEEELKIYRQLILKDPDTYHPAVVRSLSYVGMLNHALGRKKQSRASYDEALQILRPLALNDPDAHAMDLAVILHNLGALNLDQSRKSAARVAFEEELKLLQQADAKNPGQYRVEIGQVQEMLQRLR